MELMIAIVLLGIFATGVYKVMLNNQRTFAAQAQRIDLQQNIRAAATILPAEFRELDAGDSDIVAMDSSSITIRAMRQLAFICDAPVLGGGLGQVSLTVRQTPFFGDRPNFQGGDSVMVFDEGNPGIRRDDQWLHGAVTGSGNLACTDGSPGFQVQLQPQWLQALVGPLMGANGLGFTYYDSTGTSTTGDRAQVALIGIKLRARTSQVIRQANDPALAYKYDSVSVQVALRNNPRCGAGSMPPRPCG